MIQTKKLIRKVSLDSISSKKNAFIFINFDIEMEDLLCEIGKERK